jgi:hypothetical protein
MAKITLRKPVSGFNLAAINDNFSKIEAEFQNKVAYRDNPEGESNTLETNLDINGRRLYNLGPPEQANDAVRLYDLETMPVGNAVASAISAAEAKAARDDSLNRYRGAAATDPALRPDGTANQVGDEYFNTTAGLLKRWNGASWQASDINTANLAANTGATLVGGTWFGGVVATVANLATSVGSSLIGFLQAGTGAVSRSLQSKTREIVSVTDFYANGVSGPAVDPTGVTDSTLGNRAALDTSAIGQRVKIGAGTFLTSTLTPAAAKPVLMQGDGKATTLRKAANGAVINLGLSSAVCDLKIDGRGATYTGSGITVDTGVATDHQNARLIWNAHILDTAGPAVEFPVAEKGYGTYMIGGVYKPLSTTTPTVSFPTALEFNGQRFMIGVNCSSNPLIDYGNAENSMAIGCIGGVPTYSNPAARKHALVGNRLVSSSGWTVSGNSTTVTGNLITVTGGSVTFAAGLVNAVIRSNMYSIGTTFIDNAPGVSQNNQIDIPYSLYTPTWGATVAPVLGNGTLIGAFERNATKCKASITLTMGSTTAYGAGPFTFSMPNNYSPAGRATGTAYVLDISTGNEYPAVVMMVPGANIAKVYIGVAALSAAVPFTFATGDIVHLDIEFWIT